MSDQIFQHYVTFDGLNSDLDQIRLQLDTARGHGNDEAIVRLIETVSSLADIVGRIAEEIREGQRSSY